MLRNQFIRTHIHTAAAYETTATAAAATTYTADIISLCSVPHNILITYQPLSKVFGESTFYPCSVLTPNAAVLI
jgi:hypothetical protein